uniref:WD domain-containing protein, G-beta repeat-containing protein n=1 Tax=Candidatus Kentrum sp. LPFa TaxID=2126335 RepID=A0A450WX22_9GAMM|nr:MAG: WD domain-containing protein, G-beta repeat-containing protein [Candidatus Kentron sp. LPFa]
MFRADYWLSIVASLVVISATVWTFLPEKFDRSGQKMERVTSPTSNSPILTQSNRQSDYASWQALWKIQAYSLTNPVPGKGICDWHCIEFAPDGRSILSGSENNILKLWNVASGEAIQIFYRHWDRISSVAFAPDGHSMVSGSENYTLKLWDAARRPGSASGRVQLPIHIKPRTKENANANAPSKLKTQCSRISSTIILG